LAGQTGLDVFGRVVCCGSGVVLLFIAFLTFSSTSLRSHIRSCHFERAYLASIMVLSVVDLIENDTLCNKPKNSPARFFTCAFSSFSRG
jgi:hypothetical protein